MMQKFFLVLCLLSCAPNDSQSTFLQPKDCSRTFVINGRYSALLFEYANDIRFLGEIKPPLGGVFSQASYHCARKQVMATFNTYSPVSLQNQSGFLLTQSNGVQEIMDVPYRPYLFGFFDDDVVIDTGRIFVKDKQGEHELELEKVKASLLKDEVDASNFYANIMRYNLTTKKNVARYPYGGALKKMFLNEDKLYAVSRFTQINLKNGESKKIAENISHETGFEFLSALTREDRFFEIEFKNPNVQESTLPSLELNWLYEYINQKPVKRCFIQFSPKYLVGTNKAIYAFANDKAGRVARCDPTKQSVRYFNLKIPFIYSAAFDGKNFVMISNKNSDATRPLKEEHLAAFVVHVVDPEFKNILSLPIAKKGYPVGISTSYETAGIF